MLPAQHNPDQEPQQTEGGCPYIGFKANDPKMIDPVALWDATMAHRIAECFAGSSDHFMVHICGSFHCQNRLGLVEMLQHYNKELKVMVVCIYPDKSFESFDHESFAGLLSTTTCLPIASQFHIIVSPFVPRFN